MIKNIIIIVLVVLLIMGCTANPTYYTDIGLTYDVSEDLQGSQPWAVINFGAEHDMGDYSILYEYSHVSSLRNGPPFNDEYEDQINSIGVLMHYEFD